MTFIVIVTAFIPINIVITRKCQLNMNVNPPRRVFRQAIIIWSVCGDQKLCKEVFCAVPCECGVKHVDFASLAA